VPAETTGVRLRLGFSARERDEVHACPDLLDEQPRLRQERERQADEVAASLLAPQCQLGTGGEVRHQQYLLGAHWYFLFALSSKVLAGARATDSPAIARMVVAEIGPQAYRAMMQAAPDDRRGAVHVLFPSAHPPDLERLRMLDALVSRSPCGGLDLGSSPQEELIQMAISENCARLKARRRNP
jgi:hypothetical protein